MVISWILAVIVVFTATYSLILPAITIDSDTAKQEPGFVLDSGGGNPEKTNLSQPPGDIADPGGGDQDFEENRTDERTDNSAEEDQTEAPVALAGDIDTTEANTEETLSFVKVDAANTECVLSGAEFRLEKVTETAGNADEDAETMSFEETEIPAADFAAETVYECLVSDSEGRLTLTEEENSTTEFFLSYGTYRLVETKAPAGYDRKESPVMITVSPEGVRYDEGTELSEDGEGIRISEETGVYTLLISNARGIELPHTGGSGRMWLNIMGGSLFGAALLLLMIRLIGRRIRAL